jgi:two-component system, OmpR family, phosphate regulon sensor histidine kinase PhoR
MNLNEFSALIRIERESLLSIWRAQVMEFPSANGLDTPHLTDHMPNFLDELAGAFEGRSGLFNIEKIGQTSSQIHGLQRLKDGFNITDVVAEYNILRACIHDLAAERQFTLQGQPFRILNSVFDAGIGAALESYSANQALAVQKKRDEYLAFVVHDLRTPLSAISLATRVLEKKLPTQGYTADSVQMIKSLQRSVRQLETLVRNVLQENTHLDSAEGIELQLREFDLWPMIESLHEELHPVALACGVVLVNAVPDELTVYADAGALKRVFQNLIGNAIKHAPQGRVVVSACALQGKKQIEFSVRDTGFGIEESVLQNIFEAKGGHSSPSDGEVAGLGLAIVQMLVKAHNGTVRVESTLGEGSNFFFVLPSRG